MIRVAYFPLKKESDYLASPNEIIIDYAKKHLYVKSDDDMTISEYPSQETIDNISGNALADLDIPYGNITGETYSEIYRNMQIVLEWVKGLKGDIDGDYSVDIKDIMHILDGYEYGHDILKDISNKVDAVPGKGLSEYNFDSYYKNKLDTVQFGANRYYHGTNQECEYEPSVKSINGFFDHITLTIRDIDGLGDVEEGANHYVHPDKPVCKLESFGVIAVNGMSGNVSISLEDIGMDKLKDYPIIKTKTPVDEIELMSYATLQGVHNVIKNKFGHKDIITPMENRGLVEVVFTTDNDVLMQDDTWYVELRDMRTEGALFDYTGRAFALEPDTSYIWALKANRDSEVVDNKSGTLHVGPDDMIIMVGDGTIAVDRDVRISLDNSDGKWTGKTHNVRRFNIRKAEKIPYTNNRYRPYGSIVSTARKSGSNFTSKLPDGMYAAELIYYDENNDHGRGEKEIDYQMDYFEVKYSSDNVTRVSVKNQHYIPPNHMNISLSISPKLRQLTGGVIDISEYSRVEIRMRDGSYKLHDSSDGPVKYRAGELYNEANEKFEGRVIYTDSDGNEYDPVEWEIERQFTTTEYSFNVYVTEIDIGEPYTTLQVIVENPVTFDDMKLEVLVEDILGIDPDMTYESTDILNDNSKQHMDSKFVDDHLLFNIPDITITENKIYRGTLYSGDNRISNTVVLGKTGDNEFDFSAPTSGRSYINDRYRNSRNILNMGSPSLDEQGESRFDRYEDVRVYLRGSPRALENAKLQVKRSYVDELNDNKVIFGDWEDITDTRAIKLYPNEVWEDGWRNALNVQYSIRLNGENIKVDEIERTVNPYSTGGIKVHEMVAEMSRPEPPKPDPGEDPEIIDNMIVALVPSTFPNSTIGVRNSNGPKTPGAYTHGIKISDNSDQHYFELNGRTTVDDFIYFEFNYKPKVGEMLDFALFVNGIMIHESVDRVRVGSDGKPYIVNMPPGFSNGIEAAKPPRTKADLEYNAMGVPHAERYNDVRFAINPPDAKIEMKIDSQWQTVGRRVKLKRDEKNIRVRLSAYGYRVKEYVMRMWATSMQGGRVELQNKNLAISSQMGSTWVKIIYVSCVSEHGSEIGTGSGGGSKIKYKIYDQGGWKQKTSGDVFALSGEGKRLIKQVSQLDTFAHCNEETYVYSVDYDDGTTPSSMSNPVVIKIPVYSLYTNEHGDHSQYG